MPIQQQGRAPYGGGRGGSRTRRIFDRLSLPTVTGNDALNKQEVLSVDSGDTTDLSLVVTGEVVTVNGTSTITSFGTCDIGVRRYITFASALILTHNATSMILPTAANITTAAGDTCLAISLGEGNWRVQPYTLANGTILGVNDIPHGGTSASTAVAAKDNLTAQSSNIASASTTDLATATGEAVTITGTVTITAFGTVSAGAKRTLTFAGILTLTYNVTSLYLPTEANIVTGAKDVAVMLSLGSGNWKCLSYTRANGYVLVKVPIALGGTDEVTAVEGIDALRGTGGDTGAGNIIVSASGVVDITAINSDLIYMTAGANVTITGLGTGGSGERDVFFDASSFYIILQNGISAGNLVLGTGDGSGNDIKLLAGTGVTACKFRFQGGAWRLVSLWSVTGRGSPISAAGLVGVKEISILFSDVTTNNVSVSNHGFAPKSAASDTKFLRESNPPSWQPVTDAVLSTTDITTNDVSTTKHGFTPKAPNDATKFLNGLGAYAVPPGTATTQPNLNFMQETPW